MTQKQQVEALTKQADHYQNLAKTIALELFIDPNSPTAERDRRLALGHLIRAQSFRSSIKLITGQIAPVSGVK